MNRVALVIPDSWRTAAASRKRRAGPLDNGEPRVTQTRAAHLRAVPLPPVTPAPSRSSCADQQNLDTSDLSEIRRNTVASKRDQPAADSDTTLYMLMFIVGVFLVTMGIIRGGSWDIGPTIGGLACAFAARALLVAYIVPLRDSRKRVL